MIGSGVAAKSLHGAKVCVIPHPENNYRPLALRRGPLALAMALVVAAKTIALTAVALMPLPAELSTITTARIVQLTNEERVGAGLNALTVNTFLSEAAAAKAADLIKNDYFAHISPTGVTPWFWMHQAGYTYRVAGENLAIDFVEAEDVVSAWMASPTHKDNIMHSEYTETGVAVLTGEYQGGTSTVVVHMFGRPLKSTTAGTIKQTAPPSVSPETTPAATPLPTSAPTATPAPVPPRMPRIGVVDNTGFVGDSLSLEISGEAGSEISISINGEVKLTILPGSEGALIRTISLQDIPDGLVNISAVAKRGELASNETETIAVVKDALGPEVDEKDLAYVISPATDDPTALIVLPKGEWQTTTINEIAIEGVLPKYGKTLITDDLNLSFTDEAGNKTVLAGISLKPQFFVDRDTSYAVPSNRLGKLTRQLAMLIFAIISTLLILAILIRIRVQHPRLIVEASIVLVLAALGFLL